MPYIPREVRKALLRTERGPETAAELAYLVALDAADFILHEGASWTTYTDAIKALESVVDEIRRRFLHPYEDAKIKENGDVF